MALGWMLSVLQRGRAAMQRLNALFAVRARDRQPAGRATASTPFRGEIELRGVTFRYPGRPRRAAGARRRRPHASPPGRTVAVVGRTGAGKTTLVQLLPRLFDVERRQRAARRPRRPHAAARLAARGTSASCRRIRSCSRAPSARTSRFAGSTTSGDGGIALGGRGGGPRARHRRHAARPRHHRRRARHHAVGRTEAARDAGARARGARRASWSSTTRSPASTRRPSARSWTACATSSASGRPSSSRTGSRP